MASKPWHFFLFKILLSLRPVLILLFFIAVIYSNSLSVPWHLDDRPNITDNPPVTIESLTPRSLLGTMFAFPYQPGKLYRPFPMLSFGINYYFVNDNTTIFHVTNLAIHFFCSISLLYCIVLLFKTPRLQAEFEHKDVFFIALLATVIWAIHPIQIQTVTYIVQRMASMATLFSILGINSYLAFRLQTDPQKKRIFFLSLCLCFILAIGSKENAVLLPLSLALIDHVFFPSPGDQFSRFLKKCHQLSVIGFFFAFIYYFFHTGHHHHFFVTVGSRPFSVFERLLTQPSILLFHLNQLLFPTLAKFSVEHDVVLAHSFFEPWTTIPSIAFTLVLIFSALYAASKYPLFCFAILFFFVNHLIESTYIKLELIFEHRNYLPSLFLFLPVAALILKLTKTGSSRFLHMATYTALMLFIIYLGITTYKRNETWTSEIALWEDAHQKAPLSARPLSKLGELYGWKEGRTREDIARAVSYYQQALQSVTPRTSFKPAVYGNIGELYFIDGELDKAIDNYQKSVELNPIFHNSLLGLAKSYLLKGELDKATQNIKKIPVEKRLQSNYFNIYGTILIWNREYRKAQMAFRSALAFSPIKTTYMYNNGVALSKTGNYKQSEWFLKAAYTTFPEDINIQLSLVENYLCAGNTIKANEAIKNLTIMFPLATIINKLKSEPDYSRVPIDYNLVAPSIKEFMENMIVSPGSGSIPSPNLSQHHEKE